ncbi:hypothetical protein O181_001945 [Austropuccinia psidii MF-1]|uniref:Uncharacterized protein n=1 Tax=Austropuccinia psidii MF-1 TaxID=1389203 RepID=A0A9Q3BBI0_9BASI|nr:hypothetical protein [Austropuccinia psidii MF-1]
MLHEQKSLRKDVVMKLLIRDFPETYALFLGDGIILDSEDALLELGSNTYSRRSPELVESLQLLDKAYCQLFPTLCSKKERRTKIQLLRPSIHSAPASSWTSYGVIPPHIPSNWIQPEALLKLTSS